MNEDDIVWPCQLSAALREALLASSKTLRLESDEDLVLGKDVASGISYVRHGVAFCHIDGNRRSAPMLVFAKGTWFGGTTVFRTPDFKYCVHRLDDAEIINFPAEIIRDMSQHRPEIYKFLYFALEKMSAITTEQLLSYPAMDVNQKMAYFLLRTISKFPQIAGTTPIIDLYQDDIAKALGLSRQKANQSLRELMRLGAIHVRRGQILISNGNALADMVRAAVSVVASRLT